MTPIEIFTARMLDAEMATDPRQGLAAAACAHIFTLITPRTSSERVWFEGLVEADDWIRPHPGQSLIVWLNPDGSVCNIDMRPTNYAKERVASCTDAILVTTPSDTP